MTKRKVVTVVFFEDGSHEFLETDSGTLIHVQSDVKAVYHATGKEDATLAIASQSSHE